MINKKCLICNSLFLSFPCQKRKFCSMKCRNVSFRGRGNPNFNKHKLAGRRRPELSKLQKEKYKNGQLDWWKKFNEKLKNKPRENPRYGKKYIPESEKKLIKILKNNNIDFIHQKGIQYKSGRGFHYIVDFFIKNKNLIIEIDDYPKQNNYDKLRETFLKERYNFLRVDWRYYTKQSVLKEINKFKNVINSM